MEIEDQNGSLEFGVIQNLGQGANADVEQNKKRVLERADVIEEMKKQLRLAGPLIFISLLNFGIQVISAMFVGHLGELALAGASMPNSFTFVTGVSLLLTSTNTVILENGTTGGCGLQKIGAYINLGSYYLVGVPSAILLGFVLHLGGKGLWLGIICAGSVQVLSLVIVIARINWEQEAKNATNRVNDSVIPEIVS
ncbi:hypothetical protein RIF29_35124 [Crotalaria pallida]|uniref:Uncharacterized protein n=1 Tax=Crotalaria pallida TaxID=3830 RepID=A0AAN9EFI9_CROPI